MRRLRAVLHDHPDIALALARVMAERLEKANRNAGSTSSISRG
ncbi:MAG TPA: hypothetical protein VEL51_17685 [Vicinamibacterales bacterium]|nr:hypothetical protein [Vicinamibacterales bacterium]